MTDYKDIDLIKKEIEKLDDTYDKRTIKKCLKIINKVPSTEMKPLLRGTWEKQKSAYMADDSLYSCSNCHEYYVKHDYCPFCGSYNKE